MGDRSQSSGGPPNVLRQGASGSPGLREGDELRVDGQNAINYQSSQQYSHASQPRPESFNMNHMSAALPEVSQQNHGNQRYPPVSSAGVNYSAQNIQQYPGSQNLHQVPQGAYNTPYLAQYQGAYGQNSSPPNFQAGGLPSNQYYPNQGFVGQQQSQQQHQIPPQYYIQPNQYPQSHIYPGIPSNVQYGARSNSFPAEGRFPALQRSAGYMGVNFSEADSGRQISAMSGSNPSSVVRGPPRKPRQSGHAIWIGNLPPQTDLMNLVLHVCKEAPGLESLFLISKSNCAFANFKDEPSCADAQSKIHDSKFQTVRLVSRLRRSSVPSPSGVIAPTGPAALTPPPPPPPVARSPSPDHDQKGKEAGMNKFEHAENVDGNLPNDKFFVVKSLTVEDLELSVRNGIWATQSHNEEALNKAFQAVDNVYLVFSANKSGEYFGYARMASKINDDPAAAIEFAPMAQTVEDPELPKAIPTPASEFTPKGRIIDDSARGTIFWEAERDEEEEEADSDSNKSEAGEPSSPSKAWGKPFKVEWVSTNRLPFYRTRGLRNPWNSNREVKIARDGTELETSVGRRLISLFHRVPSPITQQTGHMPNGPGYPPVQRLP